MKESLTPSTATAATPRKRESGRGAHVTCHPSPPTMSPQRYSSPMQSLSAPQLWSKLDPGLHPEEFLHHRYSLWLERALQYLMGPRMVSQLIQWEFPTGAISRDIDTAAKFIDAGAATVGILVWCWYWNSPWWPYHWLCQKPFMKQ